MGRFRWYRKLRGGYWVKYDLAHHGGYCADVWMKISYSEYVLTKGHEAFMSRVIKREAW